MRKLATTVDPTTLNKALLESVQSTNMACFLELCSIVDGNKDVTRGLLGKAAAAGNAAAVEKVLGMKWYDGIYLAHAVLQASRSDACSFELFEHVMTACESAIYAYDDDNADMILRNMDDALNSATTPHVALKLLEASARPSLTALHHAVYKVKGEGDAWLGVVARMLEVPSCTSSYCRNLEKRQCILYYAVEKSGTESLVRTLLWHVRPEDATVQQVKTVQLCAGVAKGEVAKLVHEWLNARQPV